MGDAKPDAIVLAGDMGESLADIEAVLLSFAKLGPPVLVIAGNHDLWARDAPSQRLWESLLPQLVRDCGCVWLEADSFVLGHVAVTGTIAWYDYSAADATIHESPATFAREKIHFNNDARLINWPWSDPSFAERVAGPFLATLDRLQCDPTVSRIVVVTHVPVLECQMARKPGDRDWRCSNAYFGNLTLGRAILKREKVSHIVSGHTHVGRSGAFDMPSGRRIVAYVIATEYRRPTWMSVIV
jgi:hypothetical protein